MTAEIRVVQVEALLLERKHVIKPEFTIDEADADSSRARFLAEHPDEAAALREKEQLRRERAEKKKLQAEDEADDAPENPDADDGAAPDDA